MHKILPILLLTLSAVAGAMVITQQAKPKLSLKPTSACALVTKAEIEQAIGTTIGKGVPHQAGKADVCAYANAKGNKVSIFVTRSQQKRNFSTLAAEAQKALPQAKVQELPGLGDKALLVEHAKAGTLVSIYRGGDVLVVSVYGIANSAKAAAAVERIARKAFSRF
jgi:hypothetical protein